MPKRINKDKRQKNNKLRSISKSIYTAENLRIAEFFRKIMCQCYKFESMNSPFKDGVAE